MVSLTLSIPPVLKERMARHREIRWSEVVRAIIARQLDSLERTNTLMRNSGLTEKDVEELAGKVEKGVVKRWRAATSATRS